MILGIGTDIVSTERLDRMVELYGDRFLRRVFTPREVQTAELRATLAERLGTRFAAKEATMKALGTGWRGGVHFTQIEVRKHPTGMPEIVLSGAARERAEELGVRRIHVSLSHESDKAMAVVILEGED
ncbi:MAG: holo-ACP synthase [Armatimonadota bacterium]|nr:holo-ACP synthase [Armatimonadota bacterium]